MSYEDQLRSSSSGAVIAIVAVVVMLVVGGLVVLGLAGLFFTRLSVSREVHFTESPPVVVEERAVMVEPHPAADLTAERPAQTATETSPSAVGVRHLTIKLDPQGKILVDGQPVDIGGIKDLLVKAREDGAIRVEVVVEVDGQCRFEHIAAVQAVCKEARVEDMRVRELKGESD